MGHHYARAVFRSDRMRCLSRRTGGDATIKASWLPGFMPKEIARQR